MKKIHERFTKKITKKSQKKILKNILGKIRKTLFKFVNSFHFDDFFMLRKSKVSQCSD